MMNKNFFAAAAVLVLLTGCLKTREELRNESAGGTQDAPASKPVAGKQRQEAAKPEVKAPPAGFRFEEYDEQLRQLNGRLDAAETKVQQMEAAAANDQKGAQQNQKMQAYEEEFKRLNEEVRLLNEQLTQLRSVTPPPAAAQPAPIKGGASAGPYEEGENSFKDKHWKEAIVAYEKYRGTYPKGKNFLDATYKIGLCFSELGMKEEAKAFYEEVVAKAPKSKEAKKAQFRLKNVK